MLFGTLATKSHEQDLSFLMSALRIENFQITRINLKFFVFWESNVGSNSSYVSFLLCYLCRVYQVYC